MNIPGSDVNKFNRVIKIAKKVIDIVGEDNFLSPYSVIPIVSQLLGLESPMMGSGKSPYSIISLIFQLKDESLLKNESQLSLGTRREIIDEIYNMIAPSLLGEEENYIELLINTKYKRFLKGQSMKRKKFKKATEEKFSLLSPLAMRLCNKGKGDFAQISHYGFIDDLYREQSFLRDFSKGIVDEWANHSYPIVTEISIRGFKRKNEVKGWIIFIANSTEQLLRSERVKSNKILQAAKLAETLGAKIIGMAGLIASFGKGGYYLTDHIKNAGFTTGHAFTVGAIIQVVKRCAAEISLDLKNTTIAVVGAGGSIGSGCAKMLMEEDVKHIVLIDIASLISYGRLENLKEYIKRNNPNVDVTISTEICDIKKAELVIIATSSLKPIVKSEYLKRGAIIIDDSFPKNVSKEILRERDDIILSEVVIRLPPSLDINVARNMPDLMDISLTRLLTCKEIYACFAETLTLALLRHRGNYGLGYSDLKLARDMISKAATFDISIAPLQSFSQIVSKERFMRAFQSRNNVKNKT